MATHDMDKKQPLPDPSSNSPISAANSRRGSVDTLNLPSGTAVGSSSAAPPPAYDTVPQTSAAAAAASSASSNPKAAAGPSSNQHIPTIDSPFDFPQSELPDYSTAASSSLQPVAIPQLQAQLTAPFIPAYPPALLGFGIPASSWLAFLQTLSAFLSADVSTQALKHAADVWAGVAAGPTQLGKGLAAHAVSSGKSIATAARHGQIPSVIGGALGLAFGSVGHVVGGVVALPARTVGALTTKPKSARARAQAYVASANADWFLPRGLRAEIVGTGELAGKLGVEVEEILYAAAATGTGAAGKGVEEGTDAKLARLRPLVGELRIGGERDGKNAMQEELVVGRASLWLLLVADK